jgi:hypothetical protein
MAFNVKRLVVSFPVVDVQPYMIGGQGRAILLRMQPIRPAHPAEPPTNCDVVAMLETGKLAVFTIPMSAWVKAQQNPITFTEAPGIQGPQAALVSAQERRP